MVACDGVGIGAHDNIRLLSGTVLHGMTSVEVTVTVGAMTGVEDSDPSCIAATPAVSPVPPVVAHESTVDVRASSTVNSVRPTQGTTGGCCGVNTGAMADSGPAGGALILRAVQTGSCLLYDAGDPSTTNCHTADTVSFFTAAVTPSTVT